MLSKMTLNIKQYYDLCIAANIDELLRFDYESIPREYVIDGLCTVLNKKNLDTESLMKLLTIIKLMYTEIIIVLQYAIHAMTDQQQIKYINVMCVKYRDELKGILQYDRDLLVDMTVSAEHNYVIHLLNLFVMQKIITTEDIANVPRNFITKANISNHIEGHYHKRSKVISIN